MKLVFGTADGAPGHFADRHFGKEGWTPGASVSLVFDDFTNSLQHTNNLMCDSGDNRRSMDRLAGEIYGK